jgi:Glycosyltransferase
MILSKKLKILFDNQIFNLQRFGGISLYYIFLIENLKKDNEFECRLPPSYSNNENIKLSNNNSKKIISKILENKYGKKIVTIANNLLNINYLKKSDFCIFHPTYYDNYFLNYISGKPFVLTVYDMIHEIFPEFFPTNDRLIYLKKNLITKANKIIAISENTKKDILDWYNIEEKKIEVIYLASTFESLNVDKPTIQLDLPKKYILYVGNRSFYKNFFFFVKSIKKILKNNNIFLICAGSSPFTFSESNYFELLNIKEYVLHISFYDYCNLKYLYENAICLVYPSLYEGFGLPILEAFQTGCPIAISDINVFKEIAQDGAAYFDPKDNVSIYNAVEKIINDLSLRERIKIRGYDILKNFKWKDTISKTKKLYKSMVE